MGGRMRSSAGGKALGMGMQTRGKVNFHWGVGGGLPGGVGVLKRHHVTSQPWCWGGGRAIPSSQGRARLGDSEFREEQEQQGDQEAGVWSCLIPVPPVPVAQCWATRAPELGA